MLVVIYILDVNLWRLTFQILHIIAKIILLHEEEPRLVCEALSKNLFFKKQLLPAIWHKAHQKYKDRKTTVKSSKLHWFG